MSKELNATTADIKLRFTAQYVISRHLDGNLTDIIPVDYTPSVMIKLNPMDTEIATLYNAALKMTHIYLTEESPSNDLYDYFDNMATLMDEMIEHMQYEIVSPSGVQFILNKRTALGVYTQMEQNDNIARELKTRANRDEKIWRLLLC